MKLFFYLVITAIPSIIWLFFYLRKDKHPEPNRMVAKIFFFGILAAIITLGIEEIYARFLSAISLKNTIVIYFFGMGFIEEFAKYLAVRIGVLKSSEFDEPTDAMLYMIIAALGFATLENIMIVNTLISVNTTGNILLMTISARGVASVFLHAIASAITGYFIARSLLLKRRRKIFVTLGILLASSFHAFYNYLVSPFVLHNTAIPYLVIIMLIVVGGIVSYLFKRLKKIKSICNT